jgi:L-aspartate oxidase
MHGANRLAGNSLLETVVVGGRVGARAMSEPEPAHDGEAAPVALTLDASTAALMWAGAGPIRTETGLRDARSSIAARITGVASHDDLCLAIVDAALARAETRGVHVRADAPAQDPALARRAFDRPRATVRD